MGYSLEAILTKQATLNDLFRNPSTTPQVRTAFENARPVELPQNVLLIPLRSEWDETYFPMGDEDEPPLDALPSLSHALAAALEELSLYGVVGYVEADFFGGEGTQAVVVWQGGRLDYGPVMQSRIGPINSVLRRLGVDRGRDYDEFSAVGLWEHRDTEDW